MTLNETLKGHAFTAGLRGPHITRLSAMANEVRFEENELILEAWQHSKYFYLLLAGSVCVELRTRAFTVCIQTLGPGDAFGWSALLDHHDTLFQVRAREGSTALCLDSMSLSSAFQQDTDLAAEMLRRALKLAARRIQATELRLSELCGVRMQQS
jgi:CRP-like cAMP-binding protein